MSDSEDAPGPRKSTRARRKTSKLRHDSDEEQDIGPPTHKAPGPAQTEALGLGLWDEALDVDIEEHPSAPSMSAKRKKKSSEDGDARPSKRVKRPANDASSDEEMPLASDLDDDDFMVMDEPSRGKRGKSGKSAGGRGMGRGGRGGKAKVPGKGTDIVIRDQRKIPPPAPRTEKAADVSDTSMNPTPSVATPPIESASITPTAAVVGPKKKLPNIKKYKDASGSLTPSAASKPPLARGVTKPVVLPSATAATSAIRAAAAKKGQDMDLSNPDVYNDLFRSAGAGANRAVNQKESAAAKRIKFDRMREEAKAKRQSEAHQNSFDLQEQLELISLHEEKMIEDGGYEFYPSNLGVRWKFEWDIDQDRKRREEEEAAKEEGEM